MDDTESWSTRYTRPQSAATFGAEVRQALEQRKDSLIDQGLASRTPEGGLRVPKDLLSRLEQQEIARVGPEMAKARGLTFTPAEPWNYVTGTLVSSANLAGGKFAMIDDGRGFSLVPWQLMRHGASGCEVGRQANSSGIWFSICRRR